MKNVLKLFWVSLFLFIISCAPKTAVLPHVKDRGLADVIAERQKINDIDTAFDIIFEKPDTEIRGEGVLSISKNGDMAMKVYSLGFLAMEMTSRNNIVKSAPKFDRNKTIILTAGLKDCLYWWDIKEYSVQEDEESFLLKNLTREIIIDKKTMLPKRQKIYFPDGKELRISYQNPAIENGIFYPSRMRIELAKYAVTLSIKTISFGTPRTETKKDEVASFISVSRGF